MHHITILQLCLLPQGDPKDVIELTDSNFQELVLDSNDMWLVEFFAPWCGHCQRLAPHWQEAATELKGKVKLGALDSTVHTVTSSKYGVSLICICLFWELTLTSSILQFYCGFLNQSSTIDIFKIHDKRIISRLLLLSIFLMFE